MNALIYIKTLLCCTPKYHADETISTFTCKQRLKECVQTRHIHFSVNLYRVLCGVILFLCLVGTIVDIAVSFTKSDSSPPNANDGFMSIRDVSIATDHDQAPNGQNPFTKSTPDSDHSHLLHSSPEVNFSTRTTLSSFHQEPAKPSKFARRVNVLHSGKWTHVRMLEVVYKLMCFA